MDILGFRWKYIFNTPYFIYIQLITTFNNKIIININKIIIYKVITFILTNK